MKEALNMVLEALERYSGVDQRACDAEDALRTAIEAAEKMEPRCAVIVEVFGKDWRLDYMSLPVGKHKLYTQNYVYTTPPAPTVQKPAEQERNFCPRCGKRTADLTVIHTCTPPQEKNT